MKNLAFALMVALAGLNTPASAAEVWWHQVPANAAQDNGNVTLLDANGNPVNMVVNPTAAAVKANRAAATQPPTVVVQATTGYWKDPVAAVANLPPAGNATGDVRMVMSTAKPYMWDGSKWIEQSSDYSGTISAGNVLIKNVATEGTSCTPNGLVAVTTTGLLLSCQSSRWRANSVVAYGGGYVLVAAQSDPSAQHCTPNPSTGACSCPEGYHARFNGYGWDRQPDPSSYVTFVCERP
ncbi:hypothetical protein [Achromobacter sp. 2789STDY5608621]|uniref:hypothetical protein n=1 Tax=Achromobacter sp. 2789STDY5608621 TaxID=1806496 RepID=UPI0006C0CB74|nr:hypothetical protein [Achromobacter sp. 2789STDY5608621]CUJ40393.1 Uncharacterised protein [Achromobacter sp. 2789STDY5608621]